MGSLAIMPPMLVAFSLVLLAQSALSLPMNAAPPSNIDFTKKIYETIFGAYTGFNQKGSRPLPEPGPDTYNTRDGMFLSLMQPAHAIDTDGGLYANAFGPFNPLGNVSATIAFSLLVDAAPAMDVLYRHNAERTISRQYGDIMRKAE